MTADNTYLFKSERLGFRVWKKPDLAHYIRMNSDEEVMRYFPKEFRPDAQGSAQSIQGLWTITIRMLTPILLLIS